MSNGHNKEKGLFLKAHKRNMEAKKSNAVIVGSATQKMLLNHVENMWFPIAHARLEFPIKPENPLPVIMYSNGNRQVSVTLGRQLKFPTKGELKIPINGKSFEVLSLLPELTSPNPPELETTYIGEPSETGCYFVINRPTNTLEAMEPRPRVAAKEKQLKMVTPDEGAVKALDDPRPKSGITLVIPKGVTDFGRLIVPFAEFIGYRPLYEQPK